MDLFIYKGGTLGIGLGMFLQARTSFLKYHQTTVILHRMLTGAALGAVLGFISFIMGQLLLAFYTPRVIVHLLSWFCLGGLLGLSSTLPHCSLKEIKEPLLKALSGSCGAFLGGCVFELLQHAQINRSVDLAGLLIVGAIIPLIMALVETRTAHSYIRVLTGKNQGQSYLLDKNRTSIGYSSGNDVILDGYSEICGHHVDIVRQERQQCFIQNADTGANVLVNYRSAHQHAMKKGDVIKIGTALLQYCEV